MPTTTTEHVNDCDLTLFIACYNEKEGILASIQTVVTAATQVGISYDIVVVDDASTDNSVQIVRDFMTQNQGIPITLIINQTNQGFGSNFAEAAFHGRGKYYRTICGDDTESVETLTSVFRRLGEADIILTYHNDAPRARSRKLVSHAFTAIVNFLSGYRLKYYNGLAVHWRWHVMSWHSNSHGFGFQADLVTRLLDRGATFIEILVVPKPRAGGRSKAFTFRNIASVANSLLQIFIRRVARSMYKQNVGSLRPRESVVTPAAARRPDTPSPYRRIET